MKSRIREALRSRRGISLVELLIAVTVLAIVAAPLLHTFVTSANLMSGSRRYGEATSVAQRIEEAVEGNSNVSVIEGSANVKNLLGAASITAADDGASCTIRGITAGSAQYDAVVTYTPVDAVNDAEITQYNEMDGTFAQPYALTEDPDILARNRFEAENIGYREGSVTASRTISVDVTKAEDTVDGEAVTRAFVTVAYSYAFGFEEPEYDADGIATGNYKAAVWKAEDYQVALFPRGYDVTGGEPLSVYLMYFPAYGSAADRIDINNETDVPMKLYLVKQWPLTSDEEGETVKLDGTALTVKETTYRAEIRQFQSTAYGGGCELFTNAGINPVTGAKLAAAVDYKIFKGRLWYTSAAGTLTGELTEKAAKERYYTVTIEVYKAGEAGAGRALYTATTAKLM